MKTLYGDTGRRFECCQRVVELEAADEESAVLAAKTRFCELENVSDWLFHADWLEVRVVKRASQGQRRALDNGTAPAVLVRRHG